MDNLFAAAAVVVCFVIILAITIGATISYHEHRMLGQYNVQAEIAHNSRMEKLDKILSLLTELEKDKNGTD